jgi:hypothetical protein
MRKAIKIYKLSELYKQKEDDLRYWNTKSIKTKMNTIHELWSNYCWMKRLKPDKQRLQRVLRVTKIPQS